jgi:N-acetylglucosaminylphosphatidylinositol deacetylase
MKPSPFSLLLVIAHPDDESMFFAPTVVAAVHSGARVHVLSLTDGAGGGCPRVRARELAEAVAALGARPADARVAAVRGVRDGLREVWDGAAAAAAVSAAAARARARAVVTFDARGVTGHANPVAAAAAARAARAADPGASWALWELRSAPLWRRFLGPLGDGGCARRGGGRAPWEQGEGTRGDVVARPGDDVVVRGRGLCPCARAHAGMRAHASQYVWFRRLWVVFATLSYVNVLRCIER